MRILPPAGDPYMALLVQWRRQEGRPRLHASLSSLALRTDQSQCYVFIPALGGFARLKRYKNLDGSPTIFFYLEPISLVPFQEVHAKQLEMQCVY
jgi:hypothetical protein